MHINERVNSELCRRRRIEMRLSPHRTARSLAIVAIDLALLLAEFADRRLHAESIRNVARILALLQFAGRRGERQCHQDQCGYCSAHRRILPLTSFGLGHKLFDRHPINRRLPVAIALKHQGLAVGREHRRHRPRIPSLMFGQSELSLYSPRQQ